MDEEALRMKHAGNVARSHEGHAAKGMKIKDHEDMWVAIQHHTFRNWVNVQLRDTGLKTQDLSEDLRDGVALVTLIEILQKRKLRKVKKVMNQHQALENVTTALNAIADDGIKLVNIGNVDIVNGNLKLILGLIWSLIMHYQIGQSKFPPKKLMLAWLKAVLPDVRVTNFTSDWNSGKYLSALLDYCRPGLFSSWKHIDTNDHTYNCKKAMEIAHREFNIPMVLEPEYLASPYLDELSGMTYLSYFMKEGGPGYNATLKWAQDTLPEHKVTNFTSDWKDGINLTHLVRKYGGPIRGFKNLNNRQENWESNLQLAIDGGRKLGIEPVLAAPDLVRPDGEHLGLMAYVAHYQWLRQRESPLDCIEVKCDVDNVRVNNPVHFKLDFLSSDVNPNDIKVQVLSRGQPQKVDVELTSRGGRGSFLATEVGFYEINVYHEEDLVEGCPVKVRALPDVSKIMFSGIDPCALGSIVEVLINSNGAGDGDIDVVATAPSGRTLDCPVKQDEVYAAMFQPDEAGEWSIGVTYDEEHIQGSPFTCHVYDPHAIRILDLENGPTAETGKPFTFIVDARACGWGDAKVDVTQDGKSIPSKTLEVDHSLYEVTFNPLIKAKHKVYVYFNGHEVKGSPFALYIGINKNEKKNSKSKSSKSKEVKDIKSSIKEYSKIGTEFHKTKTLDRRSPSPAKITDSFDSTLRNHSSLGSPAMVKQLTLTPSITEKVISNESNSFSNSFSSTENRFSSAENRFSSAENRFSSSKFIKEQSSVSFSDEQNRSSLFNQRKSLSPIPAPSPPTIPPSSPLAEVPENAAGLSSPAKVLQIAQNAAKTSEVETSQTEYVYKKSTDTSELYQKRSSTLPSRCRTTALLTEDRFRGNSVPGDDFIYTSSSLSKKDRISRNYQSNSYTKESSTFSTSLSSQGNITTAHNMDNTNNDPTDKGQIHWEVETRAESPTPISTATTFQNQPLAESFRRSPTSDVYETTNYELLNTNSDAQLYDGDRRTQGGGWSTNYEKTIKEEKISTLDTTDATFYRFNQGKEPTSPTGRPSSIPNTVRDLSTVSVGGTGVRLVAVNQRGRIDINADGDLRPDDVIVRVTGPGKKAIPTIIEENPKNRNLVAIFEPKIVGEYFVDIQIGDLSVPGSPYRCYVYDADKILVDTIPNGYVGKPVEFKIDGSKAGSGNLEILVNGGHVTSYVRNLGQQTFLASFVPHSPIKHTVEMRFNNEIIKGSPWTIDVMDHPTSSRISVLGDSIRHFPSGQLSSFDVSAPNVPKDDIQVHIVSPSKRPISSQLIDAGDGIYRVSFMTSDVGSYVVDVAVAGQKVQGCPFIAKAYDAGLIRVSDVPNGVVGQPCQFRVDASQAGEGQLEISINEGEVPNHVQVLGGGRCLVSFTPDVAKTHTIDIKFNGETVRGCPFVCRVADTSRVTLTLRHLELIAVNKPSAFNIDVDGGGSAELTVTVKTPSQAALPVSVSGSVRAGFSAEFTPVEVGAHTIIVNYNDSAVSGTPFTCKVYDASKVAVSPLPRGAIGKNVQFVVDASEAGEGNLEISISAAGRNIPTQVHPKGSARFAVSFVPLEAIDHVINISFNKEPVPGSPFVAKIQADPNRIVVSGQSLAATAVGKSSFFTISNVTGSVEDVEVSVEDLSRQYIRSY